MADQIKINVCIVWTEELRAASLALEALQKTTKETPDDEHKRLVLSALDACYAALYGIHDATHIVACDAKKGI